MALPQSAVRPVPLVQPSPAPGLPLAAPEGLPLAPPELLLAAPGGLAVQPAMVALRALAVLAEAGAWLRVA